MADELKIKSKDECRWDQVSLGEVMLRLDPGAGRIHTTRTFQVWEGGGEYNVARGSKALLWSGHRRGARLSPTIPSADWSRI